MQADNNIFDGEWWSPKWSDLSSIPLPPDPQPQDALTLQAVGDDLELGIKVPLTPVGFIPAWDQPLPKDHDEELATYPTLLWKTSEFAAAVEMSFNISQPIYNFRSLRYYDLSSVTHKLHYLQAQLEAKPDTACEYSNLLTRLLQDQGI